MWSGSKSTPVSRRGQYITMCPWKPQSPSSPGPLSLQLLSPFQHRFFSLIHRRDFRTKIHNVEIQQELLTILEALCGVALCGPSHEIWLDMAPEYFKFLFPLLQACVPLLKLFVDSSEIVSVIFALFSFVAEGYPFILDEVSIVNEMSLWCNTWSSRSSQRVKAEIIFVCLEQIRTALWRQFGTDTNLCKV